MKIPLSVQKYRIGLDFEKKTFKIRSKSLHPTVLIPLALHTQNYCPQASGTLIFVHHSTKKLAPYILLLTIKVQ
jgi:hypothetical protein